MDGIFSRTRIWTLRPKKSQPWYGWSYVQILVLQSVLFMLRFAFAIFGTEGVDVVLGTRV